jgi:hypothetical protein
VTDTFSRLERNVLKIKGATDAQIEAMSEAGITCRADLATVGDAATLAALVPVLKPALAEIVIAWGLGRPAPAAALAAVSASAGAAAASTAAPVLLAAAPAASSGSAAASAGGSGPAKTTLVLEVPEIVCVHCKTKQPKGRKSDDMCVSCGQRPTPAEASANATRPPR